MPLMVMVTPQEAILMGKRLKGGPDESGLTGFDKEIIGSPTNLTLYWKDRIMIRQQAEILRTLAEKMMLVSQRYDFTERTVVLECKSAARLAMKNIKHVNAEKTASPASLKRMMRRDTE